MVHTVITVEIPEDELQRMRDCLAEFEALESEKDCLEDDYDALRKENEFLRETLTIIDMQAMNVMQDDVPPYGAILKCGWVHEKCKEALNYNKEPM